MLGNWIDWWEFVIDVTAEKRQLCIAPRNFIAVARLCIGKLD